jgi:TRAP-type mannitol/chloroaromatic compound transport system permease large subunit
MIQFLSDNLAPVMFLSMIALFLLGFPIAFTLAAVGMLFAFVGIELGLLAPTLLLAIPERMYGVIANETLLAIPFFTFMGLILERSKMAEDLLDTVGQIFGPVRGGIAYAVILVGALLAATTGIVAASVISMGLISLPIMLRYGYDRRLASGVITASGTLAQIVPPSLVLIVMADALAVSVGDLYRAAFLPAMVLIGLYMIYVFTFTVVRPDSAPALPEEARATREPDGASGHRSLLILTIVATIAGFATLRAIPDVPTDEAVVIGVSGGALTAFVLAVLNRLFRAGLLSALAERVTFALIPPLALVFLVLGSIFLGLATPTEGGAMGATGALIMASARRRLPLDQLVHALRATAKLTTFVMFIVIGARMFSLTFYAVNGHVWVEHLFASLPGGETGFLIIVALLIFVLAFFLDFFEIAFIAVPLIAVAAKSQGIDLILLGVIIGMTLQTAFLHPPFGMALFYLRGVAPEREYVDSATGRTIAGLTTGQIYRGAIPFMLIQLVTVAVLIAWPGLVTTGGDSRPAVDAETVEDQLRQFEMLQFDQSPGLIE